MKIFKSILAALMILALMTPCALAEDVQLDLQLDLEKISEELSEAYAGLLAGAKETFSNLMEIADGANERADAAKRILSAGLDAANEVLEALRDDFAALDIQVNLLTEENFAEELDRLEQEFLERVQAIVIDEQG